MWDELFDDIATRSQRSGSLPNPTPTLLCQVWPTLAGEALASISRPLRLDDGVLTMEVRDLPLIKEWQRSPQMLLRRLRRFCPWKIEKLEFRHNPRLKPSSQTEPTEGDQSSISALPTSTERSAGPDVSSNSPGIDDPELRTLIDSISRHRAQNRDDNT